MSEDTKAYLQLVGAVLAFIVVAVLAVTAGFHFNRIMEKEAAVELWFNCVDDPECKSVRVDKTVIEKHRRPL